MKGWMFLDTKWIQNRAWAMGGRVVALQALRLAVGREGTVHPKAQEVSDPGGVAGLADVP